MLIGLILGSFILAGCGDVRAFCTTCSSAPPPAEDPEPIIHNVFTASNDGTGEISVSRIDPETGAPQTPSILTSGTSINLLDVTPNGKFLVTANISANSISSYSVAADGTLTFVETATTGVTAPRAVSIDPSGQFVYVDNYIGSGTIAQYRIDSDTGGLTYLNTIAAGNRPRGGMAFSADSAYAYVSAFFSGEVFQYSLNGTTGELSANAINTSVTTGAGPVWTALDSTGKWLYVADQYQGIFAHTVNTANGSVSGSVAGSPYTCGTDNLNVVSVDPNNRFVYGGDFGGGIICGYVINTTDGSLSGLTSTTVGCPVAQVTLDSTGDYLYASCYAAEPNLYVYRVNATTGALDAITGSPFLTGAANLNTVVVRPAPQD